MCLPLVYMLTFVKDTYPVFFLSKANRHGSKDRARDDPAFGSGKDSSPGLPRFQIISEHAGM